MRKFFLRGRQIVAIVAGSILPMLAHAQDDYISRGANWFPDDAGVKLEEKLGAQDPTTTVAFIISAVLGILAIIAITLIVYAGFKWMLSRGNEEAITSARNTLVAAAIGLLIILASYGITLYVFGVLLEATKAA